MSHRALPPLLLFAACQGHDPDGEWMAHADILNDPALTALPDHAVPPPAPLRDPSDRPDVTVYGYWPYWGDPLDTLQWDQLTHVALFNVELNADGSLSQTHRWNNNAPTAMALAAPYGVKVHVTLTSFTDAITNAVLPSATNRARAVSALAGLVNAHGAHGVNVDVEGLDSSQRANFLTFVQELKAAVPEVFLATPAVDWAGAYDYDQLAFASDGLFIMGYGYHWSGGGPGPVAPLYGGSPWGVHSLAWTVNDYRTWGTPDDKIILGLPLYGYDWPTTSTAVPGTSAGTATAAAYTSALATALTHGRQFDAPTRTPYTFPSPTRQLWYDDASSVAERVEYAIDEGLQGVGFWALTYDDADPALWTAVDALTHFAPPSPTPPVLAPLAPGQAGAINTIGFSEAAPGATVHLVVGWRPGATPVPGCPGQGLPFARPTVLGSVTADPNGDGSVNVWIPASAAGLTIQVLAVDLPACLLSAPLSDTL
jgi:spore germination protein